MRYTSHPDIELHIIKNSPYKGIDGLQIIDKSFDVLLTNIVLTEEIADDIIEFLEEYKTSK